MYKYSARIAQ